MELVFLVDVIKQCYGRKNSENDKLANEVGKGGGGN